MALFLGEEAVPRVPPSDLTNTQTSVLSCTCATVSRVHYKLMMVTLSVLKTVLIPVPCPKCYHDMYYTPNSSPSTVACTCADADKREMDHSKGKGIEKQ